MVFVCEHCHARFTDGSSRSRHVKEKHRGQTYFCPCCPKRRVSLLIKCSVCILTARYFHRIARATAFKSHVKRLHGIQDVLGPDKDAVKEFIDRHWLPKWYKADQCSQLPFFTSECIDKMRREEKKSASRAKSFSSRKKSPSVGPAEIYIECTST